MKLKEKDEKNLIDISNKIREDVVMMSYKSSSSHVGSSLSVIDILTVLYFEILNINIGNYKDKDRDKLIMSKGHAAAALYATLARKGFIKKEMLNTYTIDKSNLSGHPKRNSIPGIEVSTGSLGHGLSIACGIALANKEDNIKSKTIVIMGDGECNEGSVWESAMFAVAKKLDNLIVIIDSNKLQGLGRVKEVTSIDSLNEKWKAFNWKVEEIDGHNMNGIYSTFKQLYENQYKPTVILANTIKGKGISFMEDRLEWHYKSPNEKEYDDAVKELRK